MVEFAYVHYSCVVLSNATLFVKRSRCDILLHVIWMTILASFISNDVFPSWVVEIV